MWGNSCGWIISAAIVVVTACLVYFTATGSSAIPPTDFIKDPRHLAAIELPALPPGALPASSDTDAAPLYRRAIGEYLSQRSVYDDFARIGKLNSESASQLKAVDLLIEATPCRRMDLFGAAPQEVIAYAQAKPALDALEVLGRVCVDRLGLLNAHAGKRDEAMKYYRAGLALGQHLCRERVTYGELRVGLELVSKSIAGIASLSGDAALQQYQERLQSFTREQVDPIARIVHTIDPKIIGAQTGDVLVLAQRSEERMWRVEAILQLGRVRFMAGEGGTSGNQRAASKLLGKLIDDPDPLIRAAAIAARDLTLEQYRMQ